MKRKDLPNKTTLEAFQEVEDISSNKKKPKKYKNSEDIRKDLNV